MSSQKIHYKTALGIFLSKTEIKLDAYDASYLWALSNVQDIDDSRQFCCMSQSNFAKKCFMSREKLIDVEKKLESLRLIKRFKKWKLVYRVLGEAICLTPSTFPKSIVLCPAATRSCAQQPHDPVPSSHTTIDNIEIDNQEKEKAFSLNLEKHKTNDFDKSAGGRALKEILSKLPNVQSSGRRKHV